MTRIIIISLTILAVTFLVIGAFRQDKDLPRQTTTIETQEETEHFEEIIEIEAETSNEDPDVKTGTYEFEIDASKFNLDIEYHSNPDSVDFFRINNISDLVKKLQLERTDVPYRAYYNNRMNGSKLWGADYSHLYVASYQKRIFKGFWIGPAAGLFMNPIVLCPMLGISLSFEW
jgi:hypothetical protein